MKSLLLRQKYWLASKFVPQPYTTFTKLNQVELMPRQ